MEMLALMKSDKIFLQKLDLLKKKSDFTKILGLYTQLNLLTNKNKTIWTPRSFWWHSWVYREVILITICINYVKTQGSE